MVFFFVSLKIKLPSQRLFALVFTPLHFEYTNFMTTSSNPRIPSIVKKFLMALTGLILALFVLGHMAGNLQMFVGPDLMNEYAHKLQTLPYGLLWIVRVILLLAAVVHAWMAFLVTKENRQARPEGYFVQKTVQATLASKTMGVTGSVLLFFIVFHLLHFTTLTIYPEYKEFHTTLNGEHIHDVYSMVIAGFSKAWVSLLYIISMACLCMHLSHGVSSMFQSLGIRNNKWRSCLDCFSKLYAWVVFLGFIAIPVAVLISKYTTLNIFPV